MTRGDRLVRLAARLVLEVRLKPSLACLVLGAALFCGCGSGGLFVVNALARFGSYDVETGLAYGAHPDQRLDVYRPRTEGPAPVVIFFYGGRWESGSRAEYRFAAEALTSRGFAAVVPDYRKFPEVLFPAFVEDGARVVAWVRDRAESLGLDPDAIFVMGHSSGAHIAALLALDPHYLEDVGGRPEWIRGMIGLAGPYDFNARRADMRAVFEQAELADTQPIAFAGRTRVPLLLLHGSADQTVFTSNARNLSAAVERAGGAVETHFYPEVDHVGIVAALSIPLRGSSPVLDDVARFVEGRAHTPASGD